MMSADTENVQLRNNLISLFFCSLVSGSLELQPLMQLLLTASTQNIKGKLSNSELISRHVKDNFSVTKLYSCTNSSNIKFIHCQNGFDTSTPLIPKPQSPQLMDRNNIKAII